MICYSSVSAHFKDVSVWIMVPFGLAFVFLFIIGDVNLIGMWRFLQPFQPALKIIEI